MPCSAGKGAGLLSSSGRRAVRAPRGPALRERRPARSIEERYPGQAAYLDQVRRAADGLIGSGYLLPEDLAHILAHSARRWDLLASVPETAAAK
jgi:Alpha/beta hydrolase domain